MFSGALRNHCALADLKMNRLLDTFDTWAAGSAGAVSSVGAISGALRSPAANGVHAGSPTEDLDRAAAATSPERFAPTLVDDAPLLSLDLRRGEIRSVVWATGFRPDYGWLHVPVLDRKGRLRHDGGVVDAPGMYAMGLTFMRRRKSSFIHGAEDDARDLSAHLKRYLDGRRSASVAG
jgi:putative flavoprotein involved in K+ transport